MVWEKYMKVLLGRNFSRGIYLTPIISWHGWSSSKVLTILAPACLYSESENILFLDDWTINPISGCF